MNDKVLRIWDAETGQLCQTLSCEIGQITSVAASPVHNLIAVASKKRVIFWSLDGPPLAAQKSIGNVGRVLPNFNTYVRFSADGSFIVAYHGGLRTWELADGKKVFYHGVATCPPALSPNGLHLAVGSLDGNVRVWDRDYPKSPLIYQIGHMAGVAFSPDSKILVCVCSNGIIHLLDVSGGPEPLALNQPEACFVSMALSPSGQELATGTDKGDIILWNLPAGEKTHVLSGHTKSVSSLSYSVSGKILASASMDTTVRLWKFEVSTSERLNAVTGAKKEANMSIFNPQQSLEGVLNLITLSEMLTIEEIYGPDAFVSSPRAHAPTKRKDRQTVEEVQYISLAGTSEQRKLCVMCLGHLDRSLKDPCICRR
jgi:WD40 repeat protein